VSLLYFCPLSEIRKGLVPVMKIGITLGVIKVTKRLRSLEKLKNVVCSMHGSEIREKTEKLDELLLNVADETLKCIFGDGAYAIYRYLGNHYHFKREEIAEKPEVFSAGLGRILGSSAKVWRSLFSRVFTVRLSWNLRRGKAICFQTT